jgi:predicted ATPase
MPQLVGDHYVGLDVHRAARIAAAGHGGQTLLSEATHALTESVLPKGTSLRDLGEHRLKDLQQTERLFQLIIHGMPDDFPPLKTLDRHAYNLPMLPTPLIGREQAVRQVVDLLRREDVRLVTLTGTGGTGKTRLGLQVAAEVADAFTDGVWFVRLSRLTDPALVVPTIAQTLNLRESGDLPVNEILAEWLRQRNLLLLLDNFEQVVEAAVEVADLLATSLGLKVVVTSRVALHLQGEHEFPVAPLSLAGAHSTTVEDSPAVMLFVQRAMAIRPDFQVSEATAPAVFAICERLDGLPLAIELAATRVKALPLTVLLQRLERQLPLLTGGARDLEARQQTMRHTLAWSYDLLRPEEQRLFQRLAVFVGGWALEAAEAVCMSPGGVEPLDLDLLDGLSTLVDHSLVQSHEEWGDARFTMLQVIREYALEQLEANGEAGAIRRAHLTYYLGLAEEGETAAYRSGAEAWLGQFEREHDNFLAALAWAYQQGEAELGLRLAGALTHTWETRDNYSEGRGWLERLLTLPMADVSVPTRAKALCGVGVFAHFLADDDQSLAASEASLALTQSEQPGWVTAMAINLLGTVAWHRGDLERATTYFQEGVARLRAAGELGLAAEFTVDMGRLAAKQEDLERATAYYEEALALAQRAGIAIPAGEALGEMAEVARRQGDLLRAVTLGHEQFKTWRRVRSPGYLSMGLEGLALTAAVIGDGRRTARLLGARAALHELGDSAQHIRSFWRWADTEGAVAAVRATMGEEAWQATFEAGKALALEEAIAEALEEDGEERSPQD